MNYERSITLIMDGNFRRTRSGISSPHMGYSRFGARFAECFDKVQIVARSFPADEAIGEPVTGERVSFTDLGSNRGALALVLSVPRLVVALYRKIASPGILVIRFPGNIASLAMLLCLITGKRFSVEVVADPADYFSASASTHPLRRLAGLIHCWATRVAARHAVTARYVTTAYLQRRYPGRHANFMFGLSDVYLEDALYQASRLMSPDEGRLTVINTAMMHNHSKGHLVLLQAMAALRERGVDVHLTLVGDGVLRALLEAETRRLKLDDVVHFAGLMNAQQVVEHVAQHDLFVLPSFQEGMPRAMLEAMAAGTPVIASNVGGIPEVLMEDSMVEPGDFEALVARIEALANDKALLAERSRVHRQAAEAFSFSALQLRHRAYCVALVEAHRDA
jgi:hypothetical protein